MPSRKQPMTIETVVGMLDSSARLDEIAAKRRRIEAEEFGTLTGQRMEVRGESYETIDITGGYSIGITLSAQILAGQAAELALKYAYEFENPAKVAPGTHDLDDLYGRLSSDRKTEVETDYAARVEGHNSSPGDGWKTVEQVFRSGKDYPVAFRYATETGQAVPNAEPIFLREAVCSVLASMEVKVRWGTSR